MRGSLSVCEERAAWGSSGLPPDMSVQCSAKALRARLSEDPQGAAIWGIRAEPLAAVTRGGHGHPIEPTSTCMVHGIQDRWPPHRVSESLSICLHSPLPTL